MKAPILLISTLLLFIFSFLTGCSDDEDTITEDTTEAPQEVVYPDDCYTGRFVRFDDEGQACVYVVSAPEEHPEYILNDVLTFNPSDLPDQDYSYWAIVYFNIVDYTLALKKGFFYGLGTYYKCVVEPYHNYAK